MDLRTLLIIVHIIGTALGVGGATVNDVLFLKMFRSNRLTKDEFALVHAVSWVVWAGFFILVASGVGFMVVARVTYPQLFDNPKLWAKITIVAVLFANGLVIHGRIVPLLSRSFGGTLSGSGLFRHKTLLFTSAAVSAVSWYSALVLGAWHGINFTIPYLVLMGWYAAILGIAILAFNIMGRYLTKH